LLLCGSFTLAAKQLCLDSGSDACIGLFRTHSAGKWENFNQGIEECPNPYAFKSMCQT